MEKEFEVYEIRIPHQKKVEVLSFADEKSYRDFRAEQVAKSTDEHLDDFESADEKYENCILQDFSQVRILRSDDDALQLFFRAEQEKLHQWVQIVIACQNILKSWGWYIDDDEMRECLQAGDISDFVLKSGKTRADFDSYDEFEEAYIAEIINEYNALLERDSNLFGVKFEQKGISGAVTYSTFLLDNAWQ